MDLKERVLFNCLKNKLENDTFVELDIYSFLILIRPYIRKNNSRLKYIEEFADLIAHRERDRGLVHDAISSAIENEYELIVDSNGKDSIMGYKGIIYTKWNDEWKLLAKDNNIKINDKIIRGITLCICSLAQHTKYESYEKDKNNRRCKKHLGKIFVVAEKDKKSICLATTEGKKDSLCICFARFFGYKINDNYDYKYFKSRKVLTTIREDGKLKLLMKNKVIVEEVL